MRGRQSRQPRPGLRLTGQRDCCSTVSAATDVVLAAGPSVVALAAIGSAVWQQGRGFGHERKMADLEAVRRLLDDAAIALHDADYARAEVQSAHIQEGRWLAQRRGESVQELHEAGKSLDRLRERLTVRLGADHEVVKQFRAADEALLEMYRKASTPERLIGDDPLEWHQAIDAASDRFTEARDAFLAAAAKTAGARLP
jgi:hypothetical protein